MPHLPRSEGLAAFETSFSTNFICLEHWFDACFGSKLCHSPSRNGCETARISTFSLKQGEPELVRTPPCGHILCLCCALRLQEANGKCCVCSKALRLEDLRPVRLELQHLPRPEECTEGLEFTLLRRCGQHLSLATDAPPAGYQPHLPLEGEPGALFSRRIFGDSELHLSQLHEDLRALEHLAQQGGEEAQLLEPAMKDLKQRLAAELKGAEGLKSAETTGGHVRMELEMSLDI